MVVQFDLIESCGTKKYRQDILLKLVTTEILKLDEFCDRRKIGRTTVFNRISDGTYIEGLDYIADGCDKKFFWPCREMLMRDQLLMTMGITIAPISADPHSAAPVVIETASATTAPIQRSEDLIKPMPARRKSVPQIANSRPAGKTPAFQVRRQTVQTT